MRAFIFVTCFVAITLAHPEAGGYNYNGLQNGISQKMHQLKTHLHQQLPAEHSISNFGAPSTSYLAPPPAAPASNNLQHLDNSASAVSDLSHHQDSYNMAYQQSTNSHESGGYPYAQQTTIHKHIYVHVPPKDFEDEDVISTRVHHQPAAKQKHYKIVFIKAPTAPSIRPPLVPPLPQNEEKTLIYVLHKKPELEQDIVIPTAAPTKPSKPEVYFIKYKTKKEEAPVYGPPPKQQQQHFDVEPRSIDNPMEEYNAPMVDSISRELTAPLTTIQPALQELSNTQEQTQHQQQYSGEVPSNSYDVPTMTAAIVPEEPRPTLSAPSNQYLAPEVPQGTMSPIIVEEPHVPTNKYGPPNRFFIKKKK